MATGDAVAQKSIASSWSTGARNALNIRVGHKISITIPTGEYQSEHAEWWIEQDLPTGSTVDDVQDLLERQLQERREKWRAKISGSSNTTSGSTANKPEPARQSSEPPAQASQVSPQVKVPELQWQTNSKGNWLFSDTLGLEELVRVLKTQPKKTIVIGAYRFALSGEDDRFVNRWVHK